MLVPVCFRQLTLGSGSTGLGDGLSSAPYAVVAAPGSGYVVGDQITLVLGAGVRTPGIQFPDSRYVVSQVDRNGGVVQVYHSRSGSYVTTPGATCATTTNSVAGSGCQLSPTYVTPAIPDGATSCFLQAEAQNARFRTDGVDPTASIGTLLVAGFSPIIFNGNLNTFRCIRVSAGAILNCEFFGS